MGKLTPAGSPQPMNGLPGYGIYKTADAHFVTIGVLAESHFWSGLCRALVLDGLEDVAGVTGVVMKEELDASVAAAVRSDVALRGAARPRGERRARRTGARPLAARSGSTTSEPGARSSSMPTRPKARWLWVTSPATRFTPHVSPVRALPSRRIGLDRGFPDDVRAPRGDVCPS